MKKLKLKELENNKNKLKQYKLDKNSISEFKNKIKQVSALESEKLAIDLSALIKSDNFNDDYLKVTELIYNGADVNFDIEYNELLDICISNNYNKTIIVLLRAGIDINTLNHNQMTPIMVCAEVGNKEILELLILMGADINYENNIGETALSLALGCNNRECADILTNSQIHLNCRKISNDSLINTGKSNELLSVLHDKSIYPVKEVSVDDLIKEAEDLLNSVDNTSCKLTNEIKFDLLSIDQIFGNNQLDILNKYGTRCAITDFAILLGGFVSCLYTNEGKTRKNRTDWWWTKSYFKYNTVHVVNVAGIDDGYNVFKNFGGVRPVLSYSSIQSISSNEVRDINDIKEIEYGEYPQTIVDENYSRELETAYNNRSLRATGKKYTTNSVFYQDTDKSFRARTHTEYEYKGSKYIRFVADYWDGHDLSDGREIKNGEVYWIKVEPITWLVDKESNIALSKKILVSGFQFVYSLDYKGDFKSTFMYKYLNEIFTKDIIPSKKINNKQLIKK